MAMPERLGEFQLLTTLYMSPPPPPPPLSVSKALEPQRQAAVEKTSPTETPGKPVVAPPTTPRSRSPARRSCINDFGNIFRHAQRRPQLGFFCLHRFGFARRDRGCLHRRPRPFESAAMSS